MATLLQAIMKIGFLILSVAIMGTFVISGCGSKENELTIDIVSPIDGSIDSILDFSRHSVEVDFSSTKGLESCSLRVFLADDPEEEVNSDVIKPNVNNFTYNLQIDYRYMENNVIKQYPSGTEFILEASACGNEDCVFPVKKQSRFTIAY